MTFSLAAGAGATGADPSPAETATLSLTAAIDEALAHNPSVAVAAADLAAAHAEVTVLSPWLPNPEIEAHVGSDALTGAKGELDASLGVNQELPLPFARWARLGAASAREDAARRRLQAVRASVAVDVEVALAATAATNDELALRNDLKDAAVRLADAAKQRAGTGLSSPAEANLALIEQASSRAALADAQARAGARRADLCRLLGRTPCVPFSAAWPQRRDVVVNSGDALTKRAEVLAAERSLAATEQEVSAAELDRIPVPRLGAGYSFSRSVIDNVSPALGDDGHLLGVTVTIPIPLWDQGGGAIAKAEAARQRAAAEASQTRNNVAAQLEEAVTARAAAAAAAEAWSDVGARVDETLAWVADGYAKGATSLQEYLATRDRLVRARLDAIAARRADIEAGARLLQATGQYPVPSDLGESK